MEVKFWDPQLDYLKHKDEIDAAIQRVLTSGNLICGHSPDIEEFEKKFAEFVGVKHAIMTGGGTHALYLAYRVLGIGPGDEVIVPSHTFIGTIDQIVAVGATPILVDIGEDGLMDYEETQKAITPKTRAIVVVHLEGKLCKWNADHGIPIMEDAAQALGGVFTNGESAGSLGEIGCFSLFPAKILGGAGNAGMLTTNNDVLAQRLRLMRSNGGMGKNPDLSTEFGMQLEPDGIQGAVLNVRFKYLKDNLNRRQEVAEMYYEGLAGLPIVLPYRQLGRVYQDFVIRVQEKRGELISHLKNYKVGILGHDLIPNHQYKVLSHFKLPNTDQYIAEQIRIPCNQNLTDEEVRYVINIIKDFYGR